MLTTPAPAGSRLNGYDEIIVQDIVFRPEVTLYRRERWTTPDGRTVTADPQAGVVGGCGPDLHHYVLTLHFQGQMTCERIVALPTASGLSISKGQVVRRLTARLEMFRAEEAPFAAGLRASAYVSVDDTGARHAGKACYTTQFGSGRFTAFRTGPRLAGACARARPDRDARDPRSRAHSQQRRAVGRVCAEDRLAGAIILSDDAGQFRVGDHALCWVHAERLVHKLIPANDRQRNAVEVARRTDLVVLSPAQGVQSRPKPRTRG